jgi:hypothetical protein
MCSFCPRDAWSTGLVPVSSSCKTALPGVTNVRWRPPRFGAARHQVQEARTSIKKIKGPAFPTHLCCQRGKDVATHQNAHEG